VIDVQRIDYIRIPVTDMERATRFYGELLGLPRNPNLAHEDWVEYETGNVTLALVQPEQMGIPFNPLPVASIVLRVPDVEVARAALEEGGIAFTMETYDSGVCNGATFNDPDGNGLMLHKRYAPYADGSAP
jgi:predicted enzyme related to lactoylglutathione lyase